MSNYNIHVQDFEGPLDLLIHLIEKDKVDIYDIPIVLVTEQYIAYINDMKEYSIEVASDFLLMAAALLQIKSKMLLPKPPMEDEEDEADPRQMLVEMLVEYRRVKKRAVMLQNNLFQRFRQSFLLGDNRLQFQKSCQFLVLVYKACVLLHLDLHPKKPKSFHLPLFCSKEFLRLLFW